MSPLDVRILNDEFRARAEEDNVDGYWFFLKNVLGYKDLDEHLHGDICEILARKDGEKRFLFLLPRGHLKSSCVTIGYPMWRAIQNPERTFSIFNETEELPLEFMREVREHFEDNPVLKKHWGHLVPTGTNRVWRSDAIKLVRNRIERTPTIAASSINKATAGRHPDVMICDDIVSDRTVNTEDGIRKTLSRFRELQALLNPPSPTDHVVGTLIVIGTRWHWNDLYSYIIDNLSHYLVMKRAAVEHGKVIFPQKFTHDILAEKRETMGEWVFSAQYMNEPVDSETALFTQAMLKRATWRGDRRRFLDENVTNVFMAVDPAWEGEDNWGVVVGCVDQSGMRRILHAERIKGRPDVAIARVVAMVVGWRPQRLTFEAVGGQEWLRRNLIEQLESTGVQVPVMPITHENKAKDVRILSLVPEINFGRLRIHESCTDLLTELMQYPRGRWRDLADALEMFVRTSVAPGLRSRQRKERNRMRGTGMEEIQQLEAGKMRPKRRLGHPWQV